MSSAIVLAGLELSVNSEPLSLIPTEDESESSSLPPSSIMHLTRATLICQAWNGAWFPNATTQFLVKAHVTDDQEVIIASLHANQTSSALNLVFHADSSPKFSIQTIPVLKDSSEYTVHLSGYVEVEEDDEEFNEEEFIKTLDQAQRNKKQKKGKEDQGDDEEHDLDAEDDGEDELEDEEDDFDDNEGQEEEEEDEEEEEEDDLPTKKQQQPSKAAAGSANTPLSQSKADKKRKRVTDDEEKLVSANGHTSTSNKPVKKQQKGRDSSSTSSVSSSTHRSPDGLAWLDQTVGSGKSATAGSTVSVRYRGELENGVVFDSNMPRGQPLVFILGDGSVVKGFDHGIRGMKVGGKRVISIPAHLGYGKQGSLPKIPPNSALKFTVELVKAQ